VVGRESSQVRLRVVMDTKAATLEKHVHQFTLSDCHVYTDEYDNYNGIERERSTVAHGIKEWARDDDDDGIRECHTNTTEGMWTGLRNFLRPFRGMHKKYLSGNVAVHECRVNLKHDEDHTGKLLAPVSKIRKQEDGSIVNVAERLAARFSANG